MRGTSAEAGSRSAAEIRPFLFAFLPVFAGMVASLPQWSPGGKRAPEGPMVPGQEFGPGSEIGGQVFRMAHAVGHGHQIGRKDGRSRDGDGGVMIARCRPDSPLPPTS